jgi:hypothetical protein
MTTEEAAKGREKVGVASEPPSRPKEALGVLLCSVRSATLRKVMPVALLMWNLDTIYIRAHHPKKHAKKRENPSKRPLNSLD